jgi:hypothetical protein
MKVLESKEQEIERLKRSVNKLQKENVQLRNDQRKGSILSGGGTSNSNTISGYTKPSF